MRSHESRHKPVLPRTRVPLDFVDAIWGDAPSAGIFSQPAQGVKQKILPDRPEPCPSKGFGQPLPKKGDRGAGALDRLRVGLLLAQLLKEQTDRFNPAMEVRNVKLLVGSM